MDDAKRRTLGLIEASVKHVSVAERGRQLVLVVRDYAADGDLAEACRVLRRIEQVYLDDHIHRHAAADPDFGLAVALLIDTFGLGFAILARPAASA